MFKRPLRAGGPTIKTYQGYGGADIPKHKTAEQLIAQSKTTLVVCRVIEVKQPTYISGKYITANCTQRKLCAAPNWRKRSHG